MNEKSDRLEIECVDGEPFDQFAQLYWFFLALEVLNLYLLQHVLGQQRNAVACLEVLLLDVDKSLDDNRLCPFLGVLAIQLVDDGVQTWADFFAKLNPLLDLFAWSGVVLLMVVEIGVHEKLNYFEQVHIVVVTMLDEFVVLDPDVDVG